MPGKSEASEEDLDLALALCANDESVLQEILSCKGALVERALRRRFSNLQSADWDEVLSTALLHIWVRRKQFDPKKSSIGRWFYLLARNAAIDLWRVRQRQLNLKKSHSHGNIKSIHGAYEAIREILDSFSDDDRRIVLAYVDWGTAKEKALALSKELGTTPGNIRTKQSRLMKRIRAQLADKGFRLEAAEACDGGSK